MDFWILSIGYWVSGIENRILNIEQERNRDNSSNSSSRSRSSSAVV